MSDFENKLLLILLGSIVSGASILIGKIIWDFLNKKSNSKPNYSYDKQHPSTECKEMIIKTYHNSEWLKEKHEKTDDNGIPLWYVPRDLVRILSTLNESRIEGNAKLEAIKDVLEINQELLRTMILKS